MREKRFAPITLSPFLQVPIPRELRSSLPGHYRILADLDERLASAIPEKLKKRLNALIVSEVSHAISVRHSSLYGALLPDIPSGVSINGLGLTVRTFNCLRQRGLLAHPERLRSMVVGDLLLIRGFGARSLVDLLQALEASADSATNSMPRAVGRNRNLSVKNKSRQIQIDGTRTTIVDTVAGQRLTREAKLLARTKGAKSIFNSDPRLGGMMSMLTKSLDSAFEVASALINRTQDPTSIDHLTESIRSLRLKINTLQGLSIEEELLGLTSLKDNPRNWELVSRYYGFDGMGGATLDVTGGSFGVTRERVRQICSRVKERLSESRTYTPVLDRALIVVGRSAPITVHEAGRLLIHAGLSKVEFDIRGIVSAGQMLGKEVPFTIATIGSILVALKPNNPELGAEIVNCARKSVSKYGVATLHEIAEDESFQRPAVSIGFVREIVSSIPGFQLLDEEGGWFWIATVGKNRVLNMIAKALSVANTLEIGELRYAVARHRRMLGMCPPRRVLLELCKRLDWIVVVGTSVAARPLLAPGQVLGEYEHVMVEVLIEKGPLLDRPSFESQCAARGVGRVTFYSYLQYSPAIRQYGKGVYGLAGADVSPGIVDSLAPKRRNSSVLRDFGHAPDGSVWMLYRLSRGMVNSGMFYVPSSMREFVQGEFELRSDSNLIGKLTIKENAGWGLGPVFKRRGGEEGDYLRLKLGHQDRSASISIGDSTLLANESLPEGLALSGDGPWSIDHESD